MNPGLPDCASVARQLLGQREFFEFHRGDDARAEIGDQHPPELTLARYTGARSDDEETNLRVGAMRLLGMSDRAIERECGVDRRTIAHRLQWLERSARIPALKDRLSMISGNAAETSGLVLNVLLNRVAGGEIDADLASTIKAVACAHGITVEKFQLVTGGATERIEQVPAAGRDEAEAWFAQVKRARAEVIEAPIDCESAGESGKVAESGVVLGGCHGAATAGPLAASGLGLGSGGALGVGQVGEGGAGGVPDSGSGGGV